MRLLNGPRGMIALLALWGLCGATTAWAQSAEDHFRDGLRAWYEGKTDEARRLFDRAFSENPSDEEVAHMRDLAGWDAIFRWHQGKDGDRFRAYAEYLVTRQQVAAAPGKATEEQLAAWVETAVHGGKTIEVRFQAKVNLGDKGGDRALRYLQRYLADPSEENSTAAIEVCVHLSSDAVLPLLELLDAADARLRQNVVIALGRITDERAIPDLKYLVESEADVTVKTAAREALRRITGGTVWESWQAKELFVERGERFFLNHASFVRNYDLDWTVWRFDAESQALQGKSFRYWQYNELLAEESAYDAIKADPTFGPGWSLLVDALLQQWAEANAHLAAAQRAGRDEETELLKTTVADVHRKLVLAAPAGQFAVYSALGRALRSKKNEVALECLAILEQIATPDQLPRVEAAFPTGNPADTIIMALDSGDKRVQYRAAAALLRIAPQSAFYGMALTMTALARALQEGGNQSLLVIAENQNMKNQLVPIFELAHFIYYFAAGGQEGLARAKGFPNEDVFLIDSQMLAKPVLSESFQRDRFVQGLSATTAETFYYSLLNDYRTQGTPILVLCETPDEARAAEANFKGKKNIAGFVVPDESGKIVADELTQAVKAVFDNITDAYSGRGARFAIGAAEALGELPPTSPHLQHRELVFSSLVANAASAAEGQRSAEVTIASMKALGRLVRKVQDFDLIQVKVVPALQKALKSEHLRAADPGSTESRSQQVIGWVAYALGEIYKVYGRQAYRKDTYEALVENLRVLTDPEARRHIGLCLGKLPLEPAELQQFYQANRRHGETGWE